ncbi:MAG: hypothetical protein CVV64_08160 [Candidatus Wallbacteria bacterium HGW-Wallbacteria-1]|jgi:phage shock protein A|uniref:Phage shock protein A n=1 Tax=Candidatus Wallbacteria bacterium HGW-Wallbacteria-1 TaxID=2013854 RepID=A0A2N1PR84_9BACT|nr:MAG: hypothetical protein CVV64_08160 [Candidatus Wallbacteria bacterium HGW-Wallbacteria-1]
MGLITRIIEIIKANINSLLSKAEDPEKMLSQTIIEMNQQYLKAKNQVAATIADKKKLEKQFSTSSGEVKKWEEKAKLAIAKGDDNLAREALKRKKEAEQFAEGYRKQLEQQAKAVDLLKNSLQQLKDKIDEAKRKKDLLVARQKRAGAQVKIQNTMSHMSDDSAFELFDRMEDKISELEAKADAAMEIETDIEGGLESKFDQLELSDVDSDLEALKREMGQSTAGAPVALAAVGNEEVDSELEELRRKVKLEQAKS